jgi:hypothetical protein
MKGVIPDWLRVIRHLASVTSILVLIACKANSIPRSQPAQATSHEQQKESKDTPLQFLLTAAATDFHTQHQSHTIYFRKVHIGRVTTPEGEKQYMLCGQFLPARAKDKADWTFFVTIKTSGYEQWLGDQAASLCKQPSIIWDKGDLSSSLQSRFDSLQ